MVEKKKNKIETTIKVKKEKETRAIGGVLPGGTSLNNKTGNWRYLKPQWDRKRCIQCMMCYNSCPENCIGSEIKSKTIRRTETNFDFCKGCGICASVCPVKCIKMIEE
jgi:pyruvate ferredoxin oxidoreductase delta subunit